MPSARPKTATKKRSPAKSAAAPARGRVPAGGVTVSPYPPISDYALIGDCHSAALVSRTGSIDWCCLPRFDSDSCFGRLLDWDKGGYFSITPVGRYRVRREYRPDSLILVTTFTTRTGRARLVDFFAMRSGGRLHPRRELIRVIHGLQGHISFDVAFVPRLDFGEIKPWIFGSGTGAHSVVGSNAGLRIFGDVPLKIAGDHDMHARVEVRPGVRYHLGLQFFRPDESLKPRSAKEDIATMKAHYLETQRWWKDWGSKVRYRDGHGVSIMRSAITLKALSYAPTGAITAAVTTSLPENIGGERNWDYRYCWIRDSIFTVRALNTLGLGAEADGVRRFIQRSAAGNAEELQVMYGVDGKRRLTEICLKTLDGWRGSRPVRIGNAAYDQFQLDMYGLVIQLACRWAEHGVAPERDYWDFLVEIVEVAIEKSRLPDRGIWEIRSKPRHFVHSKVMCWAAVDGGIMLAEKYLLTAPLERWRHERAELRRNIEAHGVDHKRGIFVESYGSKAVDAALLLLPGTNFVAFDDPRMVHTTNAIRSELSWGGLILRYKSEDGLRGREGVFLACTYWLVECLARQGRYREARRMFTRANAAGNDLGLFAEQYAPQRKEMLGNFPQGLTHLAHISAALALNPKPSRRRPAAKSRRRRRGARV